MMTYVKRPESEKRAIVASCRRSGVPRTRFALENGIAPSSLAKWIERCTPAPMALPSFATVEVVDDAPPPPNLLVHLGTSGLRMEVPAAFDASELRRLVGALC
jgi:transposase-like protein